jgi:hypothetical protein
LVKRQKKAAAKTRATKRQASKPRASARPAPKAKAAPPRRKQKSKRARPAAATRSRIKTPRLERSRRTLEEPVPTPPSSLNMRRRGSAVRTGRAEMAEALEDHATMTPAITGGDVDADVQTAYFSGDEAPGGDNPTPDQDVVEDIGRALGVEYQDNEELKASDKITSRDRHRWELDPASSEDYKGRK